VDWWEIAPDLIRTGEARRGAGFIDDQTSAPIYRGYVPNGMTLEAALETAEGESRGIQKTFDGGDGAARPGMLDLQKLAR